MVSKDNIANNKKPSSTDAGIPHLQHLISIDDLNKQQLQHILTFANEFLDGTQLRDTFKPYLNNKTIANLIFENSTRTRCSFEIAAKKLAANVINLNLEQSSISKGEDLIDTIANLQAMGVDCFIVRHRQDGTAQRIADYLGDSAAVINAGDGQHAHPSQALLDMFTINYFKPGWSGLSVAFIGDIKHSRVARSDIKALYCLGVKDIRVIAPEALQPDGSEQLPIKIFSDLATGLQGVDVVVTLRLQRERMQNQAFNVDQFHQQFGLTETTLKFAKLDAIVMHPGPINRGVEIQSEVADGDQSVILQQVTFGVAVRMAIMTLMLNNN